jgi:hypothetical protein
VHCLRLPSVAARPLSVPLRSIAGAASQSRQLDWAATEGKI